MPVITDNKQAKVIRIKPLHLHNSPTLVFPTIITQYEDKWTPRWQTEYVYGRMDPMGFYSGTGRDLVLGFRIISDDEQESVLNMKSLQKLIQYQYPRFQPQNRHVSVLEAPPYFELQFMNVVSSGGAKTGGIGALQGFFNGPISVNPGFQTKDNAQYYNKNFSKIMFSDVEITLTMTVTHERLIGNYSSYGFGGRRDQSRSYPYNITSRDAPNPQAASKEGNKAAPPPTAAANQKAPPPNYAALAQAGLNLIKQAETNAKLEKYEARLEKIMSSARGPGGRGVTSVPLSARRGIQESAMKAYGLTRKDVKSSITAELITQQFLRK